MNRPVYSVLLGTAVGDSLGLPAENLSAGQIRRRWPGPLRHRFLFGFGMVSDDTEHTVFVAQSLAGNPDAKSFQRLLAWKLRWWLLCLPAGIGFATLRATLKLWMGVSPQRSGVHSAGNGPAMRSAILGVRFAGKIAEIREYVRASTRLTHLDSRAETAALAVALTASLNVTSGESAVSNLKTIRETWNSANPEDVAWTSLVEKMLSAHQRQLSVNAFAEELSLKERVTGYAYHTVPVALYAWLHHFGDFRSGLETVISCGGDTDTVGAITGALLALNATIPDEWASGLRDFPISHSYLEDLAGALESESMASPPFHWVAIPFRNIVFIVVVFAHVLGRMLPW